MTMIAAVNRIEDIGELRALLHDYLAHELEQLEAVSGMAVEIGPLLANTMEHLGDYLPPRGRLFLARDRDGGLVGCVFLRMIRPDAAEVKRLYVTPAARGAGLGRKLMERLLAVARELGAAEVLLDTGVYDEAAQALYRKLGFREIGRYPEGENDPALAPYLVFMGMRVGG